MVNLIKNITFWLGVDERIQFEFFICFILYAWQTMHWFVLR